MRHAPIISIIVPIYNVEDHIIACLDSLINQTLREVEIICVDDCSNDSSSNIVANYAARDNRIKPIYLRKNMGTSYARKVGVQNAQGQYIMFCDSDDMFAPKTCETIVFEMSRDPVDILQFGTNVIFHGLPSSQEQKDLALVLKPYLKKYSGNLCHACFKEHRWNYTLWNKVYSAVICKQAFSNISDRYIVVSEDLYAFFLISLYAVSYRGIKDKLYYYNYGIGITQTQSTYLNGESFKKQCTRLDVIEELNSFAQKNNLESSYRNLLSSIKNTIIRDLIWQWRHKLSMSNAKDCYTYLLDRLGVSCVVSEIAKQFWNDSEGILDRLAVSRQIVSAGKKARNIGVYYHRLRNGGVEKVLSKLLFQWKQLGYNLILFTDEEATDEDYTIPNDILRIVIPDFRDSYGAKYKKRARFWEYVIKKNNIDTILYHSCTCYLLLWDTLLLKGLKCNLVIETHSMFCGSMWYDPYFSTTLPRIYRMVDRVVALSNVDVTFWNNYCPAYYIPNPVESGSLKDQAELSSHNVLWVGRLAEEKKPYAMLDAFSIVYSAIPDASLTMVGDGDTPDWINGLQEYAKKLNIEHVVHFPGYELEIDHYYQNASVFVMTSLSESFSMVLAESTSHGLPVVMFELPNLELVRENKGIISVPQGDVPALAKEIINLLGDKEQRQKLGRISRSNLGKILQVDIRSEWKKLLTELENPISFTGDSTYSLILDMLLKNAHHGIENIQRDFYNRSNNVNLHYEEVLNRHEEVLNRHEEVVNRHEEVVNRHEEVVNRHEKSINHQWEVQKWHEERIQKLEIKREFFVKRYLKIILHRFIH